MIALCVDDERALLGRLTKAVGKSSDIDEVAGFERAEEALAWAREHDFDIAFLDIRLAGMSGVELAAALHEMHPALPVVFCTGYDEYMSDAFKVHATGYLIKPVSAADAQHEIDYARALLDERGAARPLLTVRCWGGFEVFDVQGRPLVFTRTKAKELFALMVYRQGMSVTVKDVCAAIFNDDAAFDERNRNHAHQLIRDLVRALEEAGAANALVRPARGSYAVDMSLLHIDETGKGELGYLEGYDWAF